MISVALAHQVAPGMRDRDICPRLQRDVDSAHKILARTDKLRTNVHLLWSPYLPVAVVRIGAARESSGGGPAVLTFMARLNREVGRLVVYPRLRLERPLTSQWA